MKGKIFNVNIRGCESKLNKNNEAYLLIHFEDDTGKPCDIVDKNMEHQSLYKRNIDGDFDVDITMGKYTSVRVIDFTPYK